MKTIKFTCIAITFLFVLTKCKTDPPTTDPNSFYLKCKVDGQAYLPENCANCMTCDLIGDTVLIIGGNRGYETIGFGIKDLGAIKQISYPLNESLLHRADYDNSPIVQDRFFTDASHTGQLNITKLDKPGRIIEGNFSFIAYNAYQNKTVSVTEGIFRLKF